MNRSLRGEFVGSLLSANRNFKTCAEPHRSFQNLKWVGLFAIVVAFANRGRPNHRVGGLAADEIKGIDGLT